MLKEIGFWDYTCPLHGSLEHYSYEDWDVLLDDMAEGGFHSLVLGIKWITTGYRSKFDWLDQDLRIAAIASDNATIHYALEQARRRGIKTWLLVVGTIFPVKEFGLNPNWVPKDARDFYGIEVGYYDIDHPGLQERMIEMFEEIVGLFGKQADGLVVELEFCDREEPHRIGLYNEWAKENDRPDYESIKKIDLQPRSFPFGHWRDFTTVRRGMALKVIEDAVRGAGFCGELSTITELENGQMVLIGNTNLEILRNAIPHWSLVTYDSIYDRNMNRLASMDFCILQPKRLGFEVNFLSRGVMTFLEPTSSLEEQWRMTLEDAATHKPDRLWFMGSDARLDGIVCSNIKLPLWGFTEGRAARRKLMEMAASAGLVKDIIK